ncbi:integrase [Azorhizobium oxalatiphilum]|uniref:Integrase n=1 Tax=Azorhizobium oxalatiphilum TaxID=980631 RepID=A0A917F7S7_9HYPH|nr:site-specific integrase [Azorhizobium oxalatiphilum]GGF56354.1 integrase [Azorhizobium oxalatiphilum]
MGTIITRNRKDGSTGYHAQIVIKRDGRVQHRETRTFDRRQAAAAWLEGREKDLAKPGALERLKDADPPLSKAILRYTQESLKEIGTTKAQVLRAILEFPIADMACSRITSVELVEFAKAKIATGVVPLTVANYMSHLSAVFRVASAAWGFKLDMAEMEKARVVTARLGYTGKGMSRDRRPSLDELDKLLTHFSEVERRRPRAVPMTKVVVFALFSARRQDEIVRIAWEDLQEDGSRVLVRDMKNPGQKIGNDVWCDLPAEALAVIRSMPRRKSGPIFPYSRLAISANFTRACAFLGIEDLHFHDLRHEGVSRLFEMGNNIPHVAAVSGHRSWSSLKRYTHLQKTGDKYENWVWTSRLTRPSSGL